MEPTTGKRNSRITLHEVATLAGVSTSTASFVLNGKSSSLRISADTRDRVMSAAAQLDYSPNLLVKSLQTGRTNVLSFFNAFRTRSYNDLYMDRLRASLEVAAGTMGYDLLVHCAFSKTPTQTYQFLNGGHSDGVILFAPIDEDPLLPLLRTSKLPTVLINSTDPLGILGSVREDYLEAMEQVADLLISRGHRNILPLVEEGALVRDAEERVLALKESLLKRGVELQTPAKVVADTEWLERELPTIRKETGNPTAIFCWRDFLAYRVVEAADQLGWNIPTELSVVGYDGIHWPSTSVHEVASVVIDFQTLAHKTVSILDATLRGQDATSVQWKLEAVVSLGSTMGPANT